MSSTNDSSPINIEWTPQNASSQERIIVGLLYFCSAIIFLFLQFSVLIVFVIYKDLRTHLCYRIMIVISIADIIQLIVHSYGGLITIFNNSFNQFMEKIFGGLLNSMAITLWPLGFVLALNRLLVFLPRKMGENRERILFNWLIAISLLHGLSLYPFYLTEYFNFGFRNYCWAYLEGNSNFRWIEDFSETQPLPYLFLTFLIYLFILGIMFNQRRKMSKQFVQQKHQQIRSNSTITFPANSPSSQLAPHERRLLIQSLAQFVVEFSLCSIWFWQTIDPNAAEWGGLEFIVFMNWYWIFFNGFKAIIYIGINRTIRHRVFSLWKLKMEKESAWLSLMKPKTVIGVRNGSFVGAMGLNTNIQMSNIQQNQTPRNTHSR